MSDKANISNEDSTVGKYAPIFIFVLSLISALLPRYLMRFKSFLKKLPLISAFVTGILLASFIDMLEHINEPHESSKKSGSHSGHHNHASGNHNHSHGHGHEHNHSGGIWPLFSGCFVFLCLVAVDVLYMGCGHQHGHSHEHKHEHDHHLEDEPKVKNNNENEVENGESYPLSQRTNTDNNKCHMHDHVHHEGHEDRIHEDVNHEDHDHKHKSNDHVYHEKHEDNMHDNANHEDHEHHIHDHSHNEEHHSHEHFDHVVSDNKGAYSLIEFPVKNHESVKSSNGFISGMCNTSVISKSTNKFKALVSLFAISMHSVFEGLAVSSNVSKTYLLGLLLHKILESFSVGNSISNSQFSSTTQVILVIIFSSLTPLAIWVKDLEFIKSISNIDTWFMSWSLWALIYVIFYENLLHMFSEKQNRISKLGCVVVGLCFGMAGVILGHDHSHHNHSH